jgi:hypothetical protein
MLIGNCSELNVNGTESAGRPARLNGTVARIMCVEGTFSPMTRARSVVQVHPGPPFSPFTVPRISSKNHSVNDARETLRSKNGEGSGALT